MSRVVSRGEALRFQFDGAAYRGQHGDTLAAAPTKRPAPTIAILSAQGACH